MKMNGARIVVESLKQEGVDTIFCYIGGAVIPIFDELCQHGGNFRLIQPRHEQGGAHAADGYSRSTGKVGVVIVTSGPGATNMVTGIATAHMDSVPMVVITGQVPSSCIGTDAFQEADITGITLPITKANFLVKNIDDLAMTFKKAFHIAATGRPGPVLIDIPSDIQRQMTEFVYPQELEINSYRPKSKGHPKQIEAAVELIKNAKKPVILAGGGVTFSDSAAIVNEFIEKYRIPIVTTLMGNGVYPGKDGLCLGGIGMHGTLYGNYAIQHTDLLIALGVRFSDRIIGDGKSFCSQAKIIQVDIDPAEIGKNIDIDVPIVGDIKQVVREFIVKSECHQSYDVWIEELIDYKRSNPMVFSNGDDILKPQYLIELVNTYFPKDTIVASDVGQNQMWVAQYYKFTHPRCYLTSGGLGTMGYALPAAIGAKVGYPERQVLMIAGDGGFQMNIQELGTIRKYNLNIKMLLLDNNYLGMVRQWQQLLCQKRYAETVMEDNPDFVALAEAYGISARKIGSKQQAEAAVIELAESNQPMLLHAMISREENVLPMVPAGKPLFQVLTEIE
jgi:acetolactate synthase-1/2/3 large subunit